MILAMAPAGIADASLADESMLVVRPGETIPINIDGVEGSAVVDPSEGRGLVLNPRLAFRLPVGRSRCRTGSVIGPVRLEGACKETWIDMSGIRFRRYVTWYAASPIGGADAVIGAIDLPHQVIRFELGPATSGERAVSLPLAEATGRGLGFGTEIMLNRKPVQVYFRLKRTQTLATATAGSVIAAAQGGHLVGDPGPMLIDLGVARPVQMMRLDRPLAIGPLSIDRLAVRVADYGRTRISKVQPADPNEIVVTGTRRRDRRYDWLSVGSDALAGCSSLTIDKKRKTLTLSCR
jgi:hypothetical protein